MRPILTVALAVTHLFLFPLRAQTGEGLWRSIPTSRLLAKGEFSMFFSPDPLILGVRDGVANRLQIGTFAQLGYHILGGQEPEVYAPRLNPEFKLGIIKNVLSVGFTPFTDALTQRENEDTPQLAGDWYAVLGANGESWSWDIGAGHSFDENRTRVFTGASIPIGSVFTYTLEAIFLRSSRWEMSSLNSSLALTIDDFKIQLSALGIASGVPDRQISFSYIFKAPSDPIVWRREAESSHYVSRMRTEELSSTKKKLESQSLERITKKDTSQLTKKPKTYTGRLGDANSSRGSKNMSSRTKTAKGNYVTDFDRPIWPVDGGHISSPYGWRWIFGHREFHYGVDIAVDEGTEVKAVLSGVVVSIEYRNDSGRTIVLSHRSGLETIYAHNSRTLVRRGADVSTGQVIAHSGSTGRVTGPHLHFGVRRNGEYIDPMKLYR